jgi:hypothetical protein
MIYTVVDAAFALSIPYTTAVDRVRANAIGFASVGGTPLLDARDLEKLRGAKGQRGRPPKANA